MKSSAFGVIYFAGSTQIYPSVRTYGKCNESCNIQDHTFFEFKLLSRAARVQYERLPA